MEMQLCPVTLTGIMMLAAQDKSYEPLVRTFTPLQIISISETCFASIER